MAKKEQKFKEAKVEQTDEDLAILETQRGYRKGFDQIVKEKSEQLLPIATVNTGRLKTINEAPNAPEMSRMDGGYSPENQEISHIEEDLESAKRRAISGL